MKYECRRCRALLEPGVKVCQACQLAFDQPVPNIEPDVSSLWPLLDPIGENKGREKRRRLLIFFIAVLAVIILVMLTVAPIIRSQSAQNAIYAAERAKTNQYGVPLLLGPMNWRGPTYGESHLADLEVTDSGWQWNGPPSNPQQNLSIFMTVENKSKLTWTDVQGVLKLYDKSGNYMSTVDIDFGDLSAGQSGTQALPVPSNAAAFNLDGFTGH